MLDKDSVETAAVNIGALGIGMMELDKVLTVLVLTTALVYNILKIITWFKNHKNGKSKKF